MVAPLDTIAFDADDTLWRNEDFFLDAQQKFVDLLSAYHDEAYIRTQLHQVQIRNLSHFGYGIKGFTLSMIESAIELSDGRVTGYEIHEIIRLAKAMVAAPIHLLEGVEDLLRQLRGKVRLMVITKGDLLDQEGKFARSGLEAYFDHYEVVSDKTASTYQRLFEKYQIEPSLFLMIGNSLRSDVLPVLDAGGHALHVPYETTWQHETVAEAELEQYGPIPQCVNMGAVSDWLSRSGFQL
ncbi:HAD family hydrolase [Maribrevibacterium harenarium]|uniref:HAD family hydrolase n=1 Tax=Maribrevibacterium harenarium TaxID=2589817 RepID=A0A501X515_9GAMM|nr:HAD family hydrolase [Maribrevibacterium harenarium]TPE55533.1 HAD family hydrolase [Maribrevibacterium harenarium]